MFIDPSLLFESKLGRSEMFMSLLAELRRVLGRLRAINIALLSELRVVSDDNPPKLMYKGKAEQISNPLIAYA
jgi:hypothetical protein